MRPLSVVMTNRVAITMAAAGYALLIAALITAAVGR